jgi:flagellar biosynthetic protein FlhB
VLAYVYQLNHYRAAGGQYPMPPRNLAVPPELDPGADAGLVNG